MQLHLDGAESKKYLHIPRYIVYAPTERCASEPYSTLLLDCEGHYEYALDEGLASSSAADTQIRLGGTFCNTLIVAKAFYSSSTTSNTH